ncbi:MAG: family 43 glycosylhydrolase [Bacteroidaceae bacterium]|nr:family 43 glycosylhydrolase [Bacteroidaceae bacterium]
MKRIFLLLLALLPLLVGAQHTMFRPAQEWTDTEGRHINAHGGCLLQVGDTWYWYGEHRPYRGFTTEQGVVAYRSHDLMNWTPCGVVLAVSEAAGSPIERGCIMERPKVVFNASTGKYVMLFHLELKGRGYAAAQVGFAVSDSPTGPFTFLRALRPNAGRWPTEMRQKDIEVAQQQDGGDCECEWWTPAWRKAVRRGMFTARDHEGGQMSRDMTVFIDDDGKAYHITSSEENLTLHLNELTDDYLDFTGRYHRIAAGGQNEAPTLLKRNGTYWLICSGCTGWNPNEARMFSAQDLWGDWKQHPTPCRGEHAKTTFGGQGTYIFRMPDGRHVFMADVWNPRHLSESRHIWLPITFEDDGTPVVTWQDEWK